mgnify:FL=1
MYGIKRLRIYYDKVDDENFIKQNGKNKDIRNFKIINAHIKI